MDDTRPVPEARPAKALPRLVTPSRWGQNSRAYGIFAALSSAAFFGMTPIFGKQAILLGLPPHVVVAMRTTLACLLLLLVMLVFFRSYLYIYPAGLWGCLLAGTINGIGSLFYYSSLGRIEAGIGQLLYSLYPLFLLLWLSLDHQLPGRLTLLRLILAISAVYLLIHTGQEPIDLLGVLFMLIASALYALHIPINQRVLLDMPAPTVTAYTLLAMSIVVVPAYFLMGGGRLDNPQAWAPVLGLTLVTFFSRLTLFLGVKHLGGMQTALLGLSEILITLFFANVWLGESLSPVQWLGAGLMVTSLMLVIFDKPPKKKHLSKGWLSWLRPPAPSTDLPWQPHE
jgi:drug/metabolite transporter (DMT)-like permease